MAPLGLSKEDVNDLAFLKALSDPLEEFEETRSLGLRLVDEANIGIAPGSAFGEGGTPFIRLCFLRKADDLREATRRLRTWLGG